MKLAIKATTSLMTLVICAMFSAAGATGVGHTSGASGGYHSGGGVGVSPTVTVNDPLPNLIVDGITLGQTPSNHNPSPNMPDIDLGSNTSTHNPSPNIPSFDLGRTDSPHSANVPLPSFRNAVDTSKHNAGINIDIALPNLNIDISGMVTNVSGGGGGHNSGGGGHGCRRRCGGGNNYERNITVNNNVHNETNIENNYYIRGGSSYTYVEDRTPIYIENFNIESEILAHQGLVPLRAVCLDTSGNVHPASQVFADENVAESFSGEIYRCVIGTYMQYTMGEMVDGQRSFDHAWTETCAAGEALRYADGELTCAPQEERRPCNERSLLRRHGPGEKLVVLRGMAMNGSASYGTLGLDGGVGTYRRF